MLRFLGAILAGLVCGVLSGFGIGGGSLLMVWMTAVLSMEQKASQGVNLLYFLPCAACALIFHIKNRQIVWRAVWPAAAAGAVCAVGGALLAQQADAETLRKLFGGFLIHGQYRGHPDHQQTAAADPEPGQHTTDQPRENGTQKPQHTISRTPPAKITPPRIRCSAFAGIFRNQSPASTPPAAPPIR